MMRYKSVQATIKALDEAGTGQAVIATLNVVDKDGDVTMPGAFGEQMVPVVPAHDWDHVPIGKARLHEVGDELIAEFRLNLKIEAARDWHEALRFDLEHPPAKQEWSYGFSILDGGPTEVDGRHAYALKRLKVHEISPVLLGAGMSTRTLDVKAHHGCTVDEQAEIVLQEAKALIERLKGIKDARAQKGKAGLSDARLAQITQLVASLQALQIAPDGELAGLMLKASLRNATMRHPARH